MFRARDRAPARTHFVHDSNTVVAILWFVTGYHSQVNRIEERTEKKRDEKKKHSNVVLGKCNRLCKSTILSELNGTKRMLDFLFSC